MKIFIIFVELVIPAIQLTACVALTLKELIFSAQDEWEAFKVEYGKTYANEIEEEFRMKIYLDNCQRIARHNKDGSFKLALNEHGDELLHEISAMKTGVRGALGMNSIKKGATFIPPEGFVAPPEVDWRKEGFVTPVGNQGKCSACWAFAAIGALEGQHKRSTGQLVSLSKQNLIDCSEQNSGCVGGLATLAFLYIKNNGGVATEDSYPYEGKAGKCRFNGWNVGADGRGFVDVTFHNETALMLAVASVGPIAVLIDANHFSFKSYLSGVYVEKECSSSQFDFSHSVLVVGYGTEDGKDYWLVKNSWGTKWGEEGYIKMARNLNNQCGIANFANYPLV